MVSSLELSRSYMVRPLSGALLGAVIAVAFAGAANATPVTVDFGVIKAGTTSPGPSGSPPSGENVLAGASEQYFTTAGVTVGAIGYDASGLLRYVTQKAGTFTANGNETGIGESNDYPHPSDGSYEINTSTYLLIDNTTALAAGYLSSTFSVESIQNGEGAKVYSYSGDPTHGTNLDPSKLTLLATLTNGGALHGDNCTVASGKECQTISVPNQSGYIVVQAYDAGSARSNVVVAEEVLSSNVVTINPNAVPEPASLLVVATGVIGIGVVRRRKQA